MPREDRRISFDHEEVYKALYGFCVQKGVPKPPSGVLMRVSVDIENPLELDFIIETTREHKLENVKYTKDFTVAALMIMCRAIGIPLPKAANKSLELVNEKVVLRVQMMR